MADLSVFVSGLGLAVDLFDYTIINLLRPLLEDHFGAMSPATNGLVTMATTCGAVVGQLFFGLLADTVGRRRGLLATALLTCLGSLGCAAVQSSETVPWYLQLVLWRFVLGVGVGGEYPLGAANVVENSPSGSSGTRLATAALCMLLGQLLAPLLVLALHATGADGQVVFRASFAGGALLGGLSLAVRWQRLDETERFRRHAQGRTDCQPAWGELWQLRRPLLGTTLHWFLYDIVSYGTGLYSSTIFEASTYVGTVVNVLLLVLLSSPGYLLTLRVQETGRRRSQLVGFAGMAVCFTAIAASAPPQWLFVLLFGVQKCFDASGPGFTTYLIPAEIFPTRVRGTAHGLSAAAGKAGAVVGICAFPLAKEALGVRMVLLGCAGLSCLSCATTVLLTPAYGAAELAALERLKPDDVSAVLFGGLQAAAGEAPRAEVSEEPALLGA